MSGKWICTTVTAPSSLVMLISPPCASTRLLAIESPGPPPPACAVWRACAGSAR